MELHSNGRDVVVGNNVFHVVEHNNDFDKAVTRGFRVMGEGPEYAESLLVFLDGRKLEGILAWNDFLPNKASVKAEVLPWEEKGYGNGPRSWQQEERLEREARDRAYRDYKDSLD